MNKRMDIDTYKRTVFFQHISPKTTKESLEQALSKLDLTIEKCTVPRDAEGHTKFHAIVQFFDESSITILMSRRPLKVDGQEVFIHRQVPNQRSSKDNRDITTLIVSRPTGASLSGSQLEKYFRRYGGIDRVAQLNETDDCYVIFFKDYDSVDRAILDAPHQINNIQIDIEKGHRALYYSNSDSRESLEQENTNNQAAAPIKSILKSVKINPQVSSQIVPEKKYCIHITNLPPNTNAETVSSAFNWPIYDIVMNSPINNQSSPIECWLKGLDDQDRIEEFLENSNPIKVNGSIVEIAKMEDQLELCKFFRWGECGKADDMCDWVHIKCTAGGSCSSNCPYGHRKGSKKENQIENKMAMTYRLRLTGFKNALTPASLAKLLNESEKRCYIDRNQNQVGFLVNLITFKYAQRRLKAWHNKAIGGNQLKCEIEINEKSNLNRARSRSRIRVDKDDNDNGVSIDQRSRPRNKSRDPPRQDQSLSEPNNQSEITVINDKHIGSEGRLCAKAINDITNQKRKNSMQAASSTESIASVTDPHCNLPSDLSPADWELIRPASGSGSKVLFIRKKAETDRKYLAVLKIYKNECKEDAYRELKALTILKGEKDVVQLDESENQSNNLRDMSSNEHDLWIMTSRASKHSLQKFMNEKRQRNIDDIGILNVIKFSLNLIDIVKRVHSRGIFHQNLQPEHIVVHYEKFRTTIDQVPLTLVNFSKAYIDSDQSYQMKQENANQWYQPPQAKFLPFRCSETNDASTIVAIFIWLLTCEIPGHESNILPHQHSIIRDKIEEQISLAVQSTNTTQLVSSKINQLKTYLIDTFNHAFGYPDYEPWTIQDLECRFKSIRELLEPTNAKLNTIEDIFRSLSSAGQSFQYLSTNDQLNAIQKAAHAFTQVKTDFININKNQYEWFYRTCTWLNTAQHFMNEYRHDDILTYYCRGQQYSVIIIFLTTINDAGRIVTLSIGSTVYGKMIRIPLGQYSIAQDYKTPLQEIFDAELKNLLLLLHHELKSIQH